MKNIVSTTGNMKILLLGTSDSGKSTLFKGLKLLSGETYTREERSLFKPIIFSSLFQGCRVVLQAMESLKISLCSEKLKTHVVTILRKPFQSDVEHLPPEVSAAIKALWMDEGFQESYKQRNKYQLFDSLEYYVNSIERLERTDYIPSNEDVMRCRVTTTGITEAKVLLPSITLRLFDVGGVRSEREKWIHCFEETHLILFTVDATAYSKLLFEDETVNKMEEQLTVFDKLVNSRWFTRTRFIIVFSKIDLLEQCLSAHHPALYYPYLEVRVDQKTPTVDEYMRHLENRFLSLVEPPELRHTKVSTSYINLTDVNTYGPLSLQLFERSIHSWVPKADNK